MIPAPTAESGREYASARIAEVFAHDTMPGPVGLNEVDGLLLVSAWFRRHKGEKKMSVGEALLASRER